MTPQKILALQNFVGIFQKFLDFFSSNSEKNIIFRGHFSRKIFEVEDCEFVPVHHQQCDYQQLLTVPPRAEVLLQ